MKKNQCIDAFTKVIDQGPIFRDAYQNLAALQPELPRDCVILNARKRINEKMSQKIPISILNIKHTPFALTINEAPDIEDQKIVKEVLQYIGKAGYRRDGRNIGRKVKHVMVTCTILDNILNIRKVDFYYTTILYPGVENYETLQNVMELIISELHNLVINGLINPNGTKWKIEPYFSSTKKDIGNRDKIHKIEKNMNQIQSSKPPPGHKINLMIILKELLVWRCKEYRLNFIFGRIILHKVDYKNSEKISAASHLGRPPKLAKRDIRHIVRIIKEDRQQSLAEITKKFNDGLPSSVCNSTIYLFYVKQAGDITKGMIPK
ncbi:hypothetical protein RhiirC2_788674 [Rhizophagus irregularis]|uniref:Uncharacterized protein n=1 Tax=Rhizophagus irregularis TaxID=588596 RepID=A0A2N1MPN7_9GLOM|nr:hypothetical protein RhiirC2_788674 [Rhizophagus irregularis]